MSQATTTTTVRVLIIDDDAPMTRMIAMTLRSSGYEVATAENGRVGLDEVAAQNPDIIVLDLKMPVMDGREFYRELRRRGIETPVLILSAHGARDAQRELNANAAMSKPFLPEDLTDTIERLLGNA